MKLLWLGIAFFIFFMILLFSRQLVAGIEGIARWISTFLKQDFSAYVDLEGKVSDHIFMRRDGGLVSVIKYYGANQIIGNEEFQEFVRKVDRFISNQMGEKGHDIQVVYQQDPGTSGLVISRALARTRATAARIGLDISDVLDSEEATLSKVIVDESIWLVVSTSPSAISNPEIIATERREKSQRAVEEELPPLGFAQNPVRIIEELIPKHEAFVNEVMALFNQPGFSTATLMEAHDVIADIRRAILPKSTSPDYRPCLPGDKPPMTARNFGFRPWEDIYYPPIWTQACNVSIDESYSSGIERVLIDGVYHGTIAMDLPPQEPSRFDGLMRKLRAIPFRMSYRIYSSGMDKVKLNHTLVKFLSFHPQSDNRAIKEAIETILERSRGDVSAGQAADPALALSVVVTTWHEDERALLRNLQLISRSLQGWGGCDVLPGAGDATDLFVSGLPALSSSSPARYMLQNGSDIAKMLPLSRPASIWSDGAILFTSLDGKILPFQPGSSLQNAWVYLVFATMGSGKSVLLNTIEYGMCVAPGLKKLPMMTVIDIGESVSGVISMLQSALPEERKGEAGYFKVQMTPDFAYNVFDTQLGFEFPYSRDRDFLRNFLSIIATPAGQTKPVPMMAELMGLVVDEVYREKSRQGNPNKYQPGVKDEIDAKIEELGISIDSETTWWEVTDELFKRGATNLAIIAQRYAVPTLQDIPAILHSRAVMDVFGRTSEGKDLIETAFIMVNAALRDYPILAMPTQWDIGMCRVVGIDLNDVKGHGESGMKQTALMYAFAQQSAAKNYYLHPDVLSVCPPMYVDYHRERITEIQSEIKCLIYDEFHNTKGIEGVRKIVSIDIREGRKWNIMTVLSSQMVDDFDPDSVDLATGIFILRADNESVLKKCRETFGLSESAVQALRNDVIRPGIGLAIFNTKHGRNTQVFVNHLNPIKMWAFTSTAEEKMLRRYLYEAMPAGVARRMLAERFPKPGQFKAYVENRRLNMTSADEDADIIRSVANEMIMEWKTKGA